MKIGQRTQYRLLFPSEVTPWEEEKLEKGRLEEFEDFKVMIEVFQLEES